MTILLATGEAIAAEAIELGTIRGKGGRGDVVLPLGNVSSFEIEEH